MDISALISLICELVGGLGLFLLGMKNMSDGMQAVAGSGLRRMISAVTNNRFLATIVGVVVTCVVQSSSVTTVMVVGFVNSGVMQLTQAIGVIMGANIGTTVTGWILVLKIGKYGLPMLGGAAFIYLFARSDRWRYWAMAIMGVGMIFFGLELMKDACAIIKETPDFKLWFKEFNADDYPGVLQCAFAGCILTTLVQSSSATLGITISLASQGLISYPTAAALVLGENIGTTITAFLASLGATTNARRAAYFHVIFNMAGVLWITILFQPYILLIQSLVGVHVDVAQTDTTLRYTVQEGELQNLQFLAPLDAEIKGVEGRNVESWTARNLDETHQQIQVILKDRLAANESASIDVQVQRQPGAAEKFELTNAGDDGNYQFAVESEKETFPNRTKAIAATHTVFNIANTLLFLPFAPLFVSFLNWVVPAREFKEKSRLTDLDIRMLESPLLAIEQSRKELEKMGAGCTKMLDWLSELREQDDPDKQLADKLRHREQVLDSMQDEVAEFVTHLVSGNVPHSVAEEARLQMRMADEYESISDYIVDLDKFDRKLRRDGHRFSAEQRADLNKLNRHIAEYMTTINAAVEQHNASVLTKTEPMSKRLRDEIKQLRRKHLDELSGGDLSPATTVAYLATLNAYGRVRDHSRNIAEAVSGEK